ncbi:MAG: amidohydrolase [Chloroflexi bacterium]|nr:amidohydrolase [Chloroflexota bacterium]
MTPVIDFHTHIGRYEMYQSWVQDLYDKNLGTDARAQLDELLTPRGYDAYLEACGVDYACCLAEENPKTTGMIPNAWVAEFCAGQKRLIPFCNINPFLHARPADAFAHCIKNLGMRGIKLMPGYQGYHANDRQMYPIYARAEEWQIPVLVHTGSSIFRGFRLRYANPLDLDDVAVDFPNLTIVMAHSGRGVWYDEAFFLARLRENVFMEVAGLPPQKLLDYFPELERLADKVIFGSDFPGGPDIKKNLDAVRVLPLKDDTKEKILGGNAARLLGIVG